MIRIPFSFPAAVPGAFLLLCASAPLSLATDIAPTTSNSTNYSPPLFDSDPLTITAPISAWNNNVVLSGVISGNWNVYVNGVAPITFAGSNSFTGTLYLNNGNLKVSSAANLGSSGNLVAFNGGMLSSLNDLVVTNPISIGSGTGSVAVDGTTTANRTGATFGGVGRMTLSGAIGGNGPINKIDPGTLALMGDNNYSGGTHISAGTVELGSNTALGSGTITLTGGGLRATGAARTLTNALSFGGSFTLGRSTTLSGNATLASDSTIISANPDTSGAATSTLSGVISGAHSLTFTTGSNPIGNILVSGNNTYTGGTTISAGTITLGHRNALGTTGTITVPSGITLDASSYGIEVSRLSGSGTVTSTGRYSDNIPGGYPYNSSLGYTYKSGADTTIPTILAGTATLFKTGGGNLTLTGANTYSGGTRIAADFGTALTPGTITMGNASALGTGPVIMDLGSTLDAASYGFDLGRLSGLGTITTSGSYTYNSAVDRVIGIKISGSGSLVKSGTGNLNLNSLLSYTGGTAINAGTLSFGSDALLNYAGSMNVAAGATLDLSDYQQDFELANISGGGTVIAPDNGSDRLIYNGGAKTISANLTGSGILVVNSGSLTLTGNNALSSVIVAGTLVMGSANAIGTAPVTISGGTLDASSYGIDLTRIFANGTVTTSGVFTYNSNSDALQTTTILVGTGSLLKSGAGNLTLSTSSRTNAYSGGTTINGGKITMGNSSALGTGPVSLASGTTLDASTYAFDLGRLSGAGTLTSSAGGAYNYTSASDFTLGTSLAGRASLSKGGSGNLTLTGSNSYSGNTVISGGTLTIGNSGALGSGSVTVGSGATLNASTYGLDLARLSGAGTVTASGAYSYNSSSDFSLPTSLSGTAPLNKSGTGKLTLSGASTYTGTTTISAGWIMLGSASALGTGPIDIGPAAVLYAGAYRLDLARLSGTGTITTYNGYDYNSSSSASISAEIDGTGTLVKSGTGTLTLTHTLFSGQTTVNGGKLVVDGSLEFSAVTINNTGTLGGHGTVGAVTINTGGKISPGNSPGTMNTGAETWNGGGGYGWEINNATGTQGANPGWDWANIGGTLTLNNTSGSKFTIYVTSLDLANVGGSGHLAVNFAPGVTYTFPIATATSPILGFSADKFLIDTSAFFNDPSNQGGFAIVRSEDGLSLNLTYTAVPEPSTCAFGTVALLGGLILLRRRRTIR